MLNNQRERDRVKVTTYSERSAQLALDASIAVMVLINAQCDDAIFLPLKPRQLPETEAAELLRSGRGFRSVGVIGLVGASPRSAFKEPLDSAQVSALADAFLAYLHAFLCDGFAALQEVAEIQELVRLWHLADTRN